MGTHSKAALKKPSVMFPAVVLAGLMGFSALFLSSVKAFSASAAIYTVDGTQAEIVAESVALNRRIMEEGMVLLKNRDNALPLAEGSKITLLGSSSYNTYWGETGGGNGKTDYTYLSDSLADAGFSVNPQVAAAYAPSGLTKATVGGAVLYLEPDVSALDGVKSSFASYGDVGIVTIGRAGREGGDLAVNGLEKYGWEEGEHELVLTPNERAVINLAEQSFGKVVVLLNIPSVMEIGELAADQGIDAILYIGMPGQYGLEAVGATLSGAVDPSGRTVNTWASDLTKDPTYANTAQLGGMTDDAGNGVYTIEYEEGIYVGYKYYETAAAEGFIDYDEAVTYPFGYGLSYTEFSQKFLTDSFSIPDDATFDTYVGVDVEVTNTGSVAGKEVVQIYGHAPYTEGGIEKAEVVLVGFAKTDVIEAGESQTVTVQIRVGDLASFDWNDANGDMWYGYEIERGEYELRLQKNSHEIWEYDGGKQTIGYEVEETLAYNNDGSSADIGANENKDNLVFSKGDDFDSLYLATSGNGGTFVIMSRADFEGTFPTSPDGSAEYSEVINSKYNSAFTPDMDEVGDPWYMTEDMIPDGWTQSSGDKYRLYDMAGIDYTDTDIIEGGVWDGFTGVEAWQTFMNQLGWDELKAIISKGSHVTVAVASIGKPQQADSDGPEQLGDGTFWACANIIAGTWNTELSELRGIAIGNEALYDGFTGWYGPTANINRTPFGGRNTIYFSEDALLTGKISAANVRGAQSRGLICYVKHFALNEQEKERTGLATFVTEQAMRETYLKAFEIVVKEGGTTGIMQSMNRIGGVNCYGNYALDQTVLRDEWGFLGYTVTDAYNSALVRENMAQRMGADLPLGTWLLDIAGEWDEGANTVTYNGVPSPTQWYVVRNSAMHLLYAAANSNQTANGYDLNAVTGNTVEGFTAYVNTEIEGFDVSIDASAFGTENITYSASGLPDGLTIDAATGMIVGKVEAVGEYEFTVTVRVSEEGSQWISGSYKVSFTVEEPQATRDILPVVLICAAAAVVIAACAVVAVVVVRKRSAAKKGGSDGDKS